MTQLEGSEPILLAMDTDPIGWRCTKSEKSSLTMTACPSMLIYGSSTTALPLLSRTRKCRSPSRFALTERAVSRMGADEGER